MFRVFGKKRIHENVLATVFVNNILEIIDEGFSAIVGLINDSPEFEKSPKLKEEDVSRFTLIVLAANLKEIPNFIPTHQDSRLINHIIKHLSTAYQVEEEKFELNLRDYQSFLTRVNHPSKNNLYAMSKALFFKYNLGKFQEEYFRKLNSPNPLFLKRMDEAMALFLFDWKGVKENYHLVK